MRSLLLIALCLTLTACGFRPVHGRDYRAEQEIDLSSVIVEVDTRRLGQLLQAEITDGINPDFERAEKLYRLKIDLTETDIPLFINPDGTSSRGDIQYVSNYRLTRLLDGALVDKGTITRISSYSTSDSADYASFVSVEDAKRRGVLELGKDYRLRMGNLLARLSAAQ